MIAIIRNDLRNNQVTLVVLLLAIPLISILGATGTLPPIRALTMILGFGAFLGPIMAPSWLVGMDRAKGPMELLASLPIPRDRVVFAKLLGSALISFALLMVAATVSLAAHFIDLKSAIEFASVGTVSLLLACTVSTSAFFLMPMRVATLVVTACIGCIAPFMHPLMVAIRSLGFSIVWAALAACVFVVPLAFAAAKLVATIWSRRPSPCE